MTREVRQLILADALLLVIVVVVCVIMPGCDHTIGPAHPYQGSGLAPHADTPKLTTTSEGGTVVLVARVRVHNPTSVARRATVACRFELGRIEIAQRSASTKVPSGCSRAINLSVFSGVNDERQAAVSCETSWR
jgi:hypothetical protein